MKSSLSDRESLHTVEVHKGYKKRGKEYRNPLNVSTLHAFKSLCVVFYVCLLEKGFFLSGPFCLAASLKYVRNDERKCSFFSGIRS